MAAGLVTMSDGLGASARSAVTWVRRRPRRVILASQLVVLGLAVWFLVVPQVSRASSSLGLLFHIDNPWIPLAILAELLSLGAYALTTRSILPRKRRPSLARVLRIDLSAIALGHCLPDGGAAGTALSWRLLVLSGVPSSEAAFAKLAQGVTAAVVLQALLLTAFGLGLPATGIERWNLIPAVMSAALVIAVVLLVVALRRARVRVAIDRGLARVPRYGARIAAGAGRLYHRHAVQQIRDTFTGPRQMAATAAFAGANWALDAAALWASISAYGPGVGLGALAAAFAIQFFAAWLPLTPSGLGISEGLMIPALIAFGATSSSAVLGVLTWRLLAYWLPMPIGAIAYGSLRIQGARGEIPQVAETSRTDPAMRGDSPLSSGTALRP